MKVSSTQIQTSISKLYRTGLSTYQAKNFKLNEKEAFEKIGIEYLDSIVDANILVTNTHCDLSKYSLEDLQKIKLIIHPNSGYDNFTVPQVQGLSAPIILGNEVRAKSVASYIIACFYNAFSSPPFSKNWDKDRAWNRKSLEELSIQVIGYGQIGKILQKSLGHLVKSLTFFDPYKDQLALNEKADCLIMACSLNNETKSMIDHKFLKRFSSQCVFINAARGGLVNTDDLIAWLNENPKARAYLDVFDPEPIDFSIFPENVYKTSHLAGVDEGLDQRIINFEVKVCVDWLSLTSKQFYDKWSSVYLSNKIKGADFI